MKTLFIGGCADGELRDIPDNVRIYMVAYAPRITDPWDNHIMRDQYYRFDLEEDITIFILEGITRVGAMKRLMSKYVRKDK